MRVGRGSGKAIVAALAVATLPALAALDTTLALSHGWKPWGPLRWIRPCAAALVLVALAVVLAPRGRRLAARHFASILATTISIVVALALAEVIAHRFRILPIDHLYHLRAPYMHSAFRPAPGTMSGVSGEAHYRANYHGIRGDALPRRADAYRILCVGGSTTECLYLDQEESWPYLLQESLRGARADSSLWVGNVGMSGSGTPHDLSFLKSSNLVDQMDCIVFLVGVNDLLLFLKGFDFSYAWENRQGELRPALLKTALGNLVVAALQQALNPPPVRGIEVEDAVGLNYVERRRHRQEAVHSLPLPDPREVLFGFESRIGEMVEVCRAHGVRPVFVTQPVLWREKMPPDLEARLWMGELGGGGFVSSAALLFGMELFNEVMLRTCGNLGVETVDVRSMNGNPAYFYDDCHFNEAGSVEFARLVTRHFLSVGADGGPGG